MSELMPKKGWDFLEQEALRRARNQLGCCHLKAVKIGPLKPMGSGPNWEVLGFTPDLPIGR